MRDFFENLICVVIATLLFFVLSLVLLYASMFFGGVCTRALETVKPIFEDYRENVADSLESTYNAGYNFIFEEGCEE